jgi:hypothetical protein
MPVGFCLMPETREKFKRALKDGTIDPEKLSRMSSADRNELLGNIVGKNHAKAVNSLFESKILLKNQQQGYLTWAKQVSGIKPNVRRDLIKKIERMQNVLDPEEEKLFLSDLTATRLGVDVTEAEAKSIADLSKAVSDAEALRKADGSFPNKDARMQYGYAVEDLTDYVASLKVSAEKIKPQDLIKNPGLIGKFTNKVAGNMKSLSASLDNSSIFRQGWKVMFTDPKIWAKNAADTFVTGAKTIGGKNVLREVNADIISRPNYDRMIRAKLAIKNAEEAFPESLGEKIPALGRLYKASEAAFTGFQYKNRADVFDKYLEIAKKNGVDIDDKQQLEAIGKLINSLTGRGNLGKLEPIANSVNNYFFSPRFLKANWDTLTLHSFGTEKGMTSFARKKAATNLVKIVGGTATVLVTADALLPGSVEWDPRSSDFGKIRVGDTRFDVSGGMASILTLAARVVTHSSKSASTGSITELDSGKFGSKTWDQVVLDFFTNKLSPAAGAVKKSIDGEDFNGNETNLLKEATKTLVPIGLQNANEAFSNPNAANPILTIIADGLGIGASTYSAMGGGEKTAWEKSESKELNAYRAEVGDDKFREDAKSFEEQYNKWIDKVMDEKSYQDMSTDEKSSLIMKKKSLLQKEIFKNAGFKYKSEKKKKEVEDPLLKG